jgi:Glutathione S-transferase
MYQVIGPKKSRALRVLWALEELGAPYDHLPDMPGSDAVKALNPSGKVPVLIVDGATLTDSTAIMTYLADRHGALIPAPGTIQRAHHDALMHTVLDEMDAILWMAAKHSFILPEAQRLPAIKDSLRWEWARSLDRLAPRIAGHCLMGDEFTIADILCAHCLNWGRGSSSTSPQNLCWPISSACATAPRFSGFWRNPQLPAPPVVLSPCWR